LRLKVTGIPDYQPFILHFNRTNHVTFSMSFDKRGSDFVACLLQTVSSEVSCVYTNSLLLIESLYWSMRKLAVDLASGVYSGPYEG